MKTITNKSKPVFNLYQVIGIGVFILAFSIRIYGANSVNLTNSEAEVLLSITGIRLYEQSSFLYNLILRVIQFFGINGKLGLRIINVFAGSLIVLLPNLFINEFGKKAAILASLFFAFDPLGIANSITFSGSALTILFVGLLFESIFHRRNYLIPLIIILLLGHGRGLGILLATSFLFLLFLFFIDRDSLKRIKSIVSENASNNKNIVVMMLIIFIIIILSSVSKTPISDSASDVVNFALSLSKNYQVGNFPIVYLFAIFTYIPLAIITLLIFIIKNPKVEIKKFKLAFLWTALSFLVVTFSPGHLIIDLLWVSLPLWLITALLINNYTVELFQTLKNNLPFIGILLAISINLVLNIIALVYRSAWGMDISNILLATLLICVFIVLLVLYQAVTASITKAFSALFIVGFFLLGLFQLTISARTSGTNNKPESEILWNGYYQDQDIVKEIINRTKANTFGTSGILNIFINGRINNSILWSINNERLIFQESDTRDKKPEIIISENKTIPIIDGSYQGQEFISMSYPIWTWDPVKGIFSTDFWGWFVFRNNQQYEEYNTIWINNKTQEINSLNGVK
jgi:hypothetical protein